MGVLWRKSGLVERDLNDVAANGASAFFFVGGTTTPFVVYQDADETTPHTSPVEADAYGRWPQVFVPFTASYDEKITTSGGTQLSYYEEIPNPNPVQAAEDSVSDDQLLQTGFVIWSPRSGSLSGFARLNGRTIGSASSGATERANDDTEDLFEFLWANCSNTQCPVSGGRGLSAAADFAANKTIQLLDARSGTLMGLAGMGNIDDGNLDGASFTNGDGTTVGSAVGANTKTLITANLPAHGHAFSATTGSSGGHNHTGTTSSDGTHNHTFTGSALPPHSHSYSYYTAVRAGEVGGSDSITGNTSGTTSSVSAGTPSGTISSDGAHTHTFTTSTDGTHTHSVSGTTDNTGSATAVSIVSRGVLGTFYQKL